MMSKELLTTIALLLVAIRIAANQQASRFLISKKSKMDLFTPVRGIKLKQIKCQKVIICQQLKKS